MTKETIKIIEKCEQLARESWGGQEGENRAKKVGGFLRETLANYSKVLGFSEDKIMHAIEERRNYCVNNYYQRANFPKLDENIKIYETKDDLFKECPSKEFICPSCEGVSTDPQQCNSGKETSKGKTCDWKSYGLFGTAGKGYKFIIKDEFLIGGVVWDIFMPKELYKK